MKVFGVEYDQSSQHKIYYIFGIKISKKDKLENLRIKNEYLLNVINRIGADKIPTATGELREWQLELFNLIKIFDKVCRENNIQYWIDFGTLLGAVRHKGFIPWDDDIDISMLNTDLEKVLPILKEYFSNTNYIVRERAFNCNNFQIRIRNKRYNLGIDIFPVYEYPEACLTNESKRDLTNKIINARKSFIKKYRKKHMDNITFNQAKNDINDINKDLISQTKAKTQQKNTIIRGVEFSYLEKEYVIDSNLIFPLKNINFEGYNLLAPNKAEEYLSSLWANWQEVTLLRNVLYEHFYFGYNNDNKGDIE